MRIALGMAALGRPAYINLGRDTALPADRTPEAMREASFAVLDAAYAAGIRWVDAARSYGRAEEFVAAWLAERDVADVTVSSKWGYEYTADWRADATVHEVKEHSLARFDRQWAETQALLEVALYQVHSLTADSPLFADKDLQFQMSEIGVPVGFSTSGPAQADTIRRAFDIEVSGRRLFSAVQSTWNLLETSAGPALAEAHEAGARVMLKEVMANGRLAMQPPGPVADIAIRHGVGPDAVAMAAALAQPWADLVLSGAASVPQLYANLMPVELDVVDHELLRDLAEPPQEYWKHRSALSWN
ncbi:aldo/keto reductase [Kibdelosporangium philippinense]|uniref:Aldo/keto reductase n=1 Tax=Kibdelosporangium philippinense TaxID=211113 RepID=A0ABS8Z699_9PSEU|nr:aldo/keto reductase [Kibdelosporangium philippinense]MCE7003409.1 aldo/keto reductase [Kibdelosporangium philippinense]